MSQAPYENILVVDDDEFVTELVEEMLVDHGYRVFTAADYDGALAQLERHEIHLILCDVYLGGRSGIDLLHALRERRVECPVVMITGSPELKHATQAMHLGASDYLIKPVEPDRLLRVTRSNLERYALRKENEVMRSRLEGVFRSVQDGIVTVDRELRVLASNPAAQRLCGLSETLAEGTPFASATPACDLHCAQALRRVLADGNGLEVKAQQCVVNGEPRIYTLSVNPLHNDELLGAVLVVHDETRLKSLEEALVERRRFHRLIGGSPAMREIYALIAKLGDTPVPVLVTGESGTGKELVAEALHQQWRGGEDNAPLIRVNCAALSDELLESELFGHVKGAFTGALRDKPGRFELAHGGTIFLDEIGDISAKMQTRLLRVLQEREVERVGGTHPIKVDFQLVAATNRELRERVAAGAFREDLYHRLKVVHVALPPLRERREDIPLLVDHFLERLNRKFDRHIQGVSSAVRKRFMNYPWPGNVRELEHALEHALVVCEGERIEPADLPDDLLVEQAGAPTAPPSRLTAPAAGDDERQALLAALEAHRWNKSAAAKALGIDRRTLYRRMERLGVN